MSPVKPAAIPELKVQLGQALHRQITNHLRTLIYSGDLPAGAKLPRMHDLAAQWRTNYFTVHTALTALAQEGLLERKPRVGTFVRKKEKGLTSVGIYYGDEILVKRERAFYRSVHSQLLALLQRERIAARVFIDCRPRERQREPLLELAESVQSGAIQGLIVPLVNHGMSWINLMPLPTSIFSGMRSAQSRIHVDYLEIINMALEAFQRAGCRTVGLIHPDARPSGKDNPDENLPAAFRASLDKFGLKTRKSWLRVPVLYQDFQERYGYQEIHKLWSLAERPDGLFIYPENVCRGAVLALLEKRVRVPEDLKLVLHKNERDEFLCPLAADWIVTHEKEIAEALLQQIKDRFAGLEPRSYDIHQQFVPAAEAASIF